MTGDTRQEARIALLRRRLAKLDGERAVLQDELDQLEQLPSLPPPSSATAASNAATPTPQAISNESPAASKVALFRKLFAGRTDVFPVRWENSRSRKSGYASRRQTAPAGGIAPESEGRRCLPTTTCFIITPQAPMHVII